MTFPLGYLLGPDEGGATEKLLEPNIRLFNLSSAFIKNNTKRQFNYHWNIRAGRKINP